MGPLQPIERLMQSRGVVEAGHVACLAPGRNAVVELLLKVLKNCPATAPPPTSAVPPLPGVVSSCVESGKDPTCTSWSGGSDTTASCNQHTSTMSNGPSWGTPEWSARQEFELIRRVAAGDEQTRQLWLQKQRVTATVQQLAATAAAAAARQRHRNTRRTHRPRRRRCSRPRRRRPSSACGNTSADRESKRRALVALVAASYFHHYKPVLSNGDDCRFIFMPAHEWLDSCSDVRRGREGASGRQGVTIHSQEGRSSVAKASHASRPATSTVLY